MAQRIQRGSTLAGLVALVTLVAGGPQARADLSMTGGEDSTGASALAGAAAITITGTLIQDPGDPAYTYQFSVTATGPMFSGSFSITNLVGVDSKSLKRTDFPVTTTDGFGNPWDPSTSDKDNGPGGFKESTITWTFAPNPYSTTQYTGTNGTYLLGTFDVTTDPHYDGKLPGGYPQNVFFVDPITYSYTDGPSSGRGIPLQLTVAPEPSTAVYPLVALACLSAVGLIKRFRLRKRVMQAA